jgi:hypothetical protein
MLAAVSGNGAEVGKPELFRHHTDAATVEQRQVNLAHVGMLTNLAANGHGVLYPCSKESFLLGDNSRNWP